MTELKELGYSNKMMFYRGVGHSTTFSNRMSFTLTRPINLEHLKLAAKKTFEAYPNFAFRPVIKDNKVWKIDNSDKEIAFFDDPDVRHYYGTDDTNGYLFYFLINSEKTFSVLFFHGMTDFKGSWPIWKTLLYHYAKLEGFDVQPDEDVRLHASSEAEGLVNPYAILADASRQPSWKFKAEKLFHMSPEVEDIYPEERDQMHSYEIMLNLKQFIAKTKELGVSFVPLLVTCTTLAVYDTYKPEDSTIIAKIPVDLRHLYNIWTDENCSESFILPITPELRVKSLPEICKTLAGFMKEQLHKENYGSVVARKVNTVKGFEDGTKSIEELESENSNAHSNGGSNPDTYVITYPGRVTLRPEYYQLVERVAMEPHATTDGFYIFVGANEEDITFRLTQRFDSDRLAKSISRRFSEAGIDNHINDAGIISCEKMLVERLIHE